MLHVYKKCAKSTSVFQPHNDALLNWIVILEAFSAL